MMLNTGDEKRRGRPRLETTMPEGWHEIIIEAGREGKHITDFLITLGISWEGHHALLKRNIKYSESVDEYTKLCENYWYNLAHKSMDENGGQGFNSRLWSLIVRNKFSSRWSDQSRIDVTSQGEKIDSNPIQIEIVRKKDDED